MNDRERFLATMYYQKRDRCPWGEMGFCLRHSNDGIKRVGQIIYL